MAFDAFYLAAIKKELTQKLLGGRIAKIYQPDRHSLTLHIHSRAGKEKLHLSAHPQRGGIYLCQEGGANPLSAPLFCMVLRKHLEGAKILSFEQTGRERILQIGLLSRNELGDDALFTLIIEIMGKHSNIILIDEEGQIVDGIRRYNHFLSRHREVLPGRPYIMPPPQEKTELSDLDEEGLGALFFSMPGAVLKDALARHAGGFSPLMLEELMIRSGLSPALPVEEMGRYEFSRILQAAQELLQAFDREEFSPTLLWEGDYPKDFAALPLKLWAHQKTQAYDSPSQGAEDFYSHRQAGETFLSRQRELGKILTAHSQRLKKKLALQRQDLAKADAGEIYKLRGELLSANLYGMEKGLDAVMLEDFYHPGEQIEIPLDPSLTPEENMSRYFKLYAKAKKARGAIREQLAANQEEFIYIESVRHALAQSSTPEELSEIRQELIKGGYLKAKKADKSKGGQKKKPAAPGYKLPPRRFLSQEGYEILVGRNNNQNDFLTFRLAHKEDIWFHAKDIPGSHVILRAQGKAVSEEALAEAAAIAAWYSQARQGDKIAVDYTTVDQVKKPRGAKPGMVIYFQQKTLLVNPQDPGAERQEAPADN